MIRFVIAVSAIATFAAAAAAQDRRTVVEPKIPPACATLEAALTSRGATLDDASETRLDTVRIQKALDACEPGHAVVLRAKGERNAFLSGPLELRQGVTLVVDRGAILLASRNPADYETRPGSCGIVDKNGRGCRPLIGGTGVSGAGVMGDGAIDGRGGFKLIGRDVSWWDLAEQARQGGAQNCPRILVLTGCDDFTLYRITLRNSANFHVSYRNGRGFTAWGVKVYSPQRGARNTDGIDPGNSTDVTIAHCFIHTGDDNVAIKAGRGAPTTNMTIAHNHFYAGHGMSIGSETDGGASAIRVTDLSIDGADNGIRIKSNSSRGGLVRDAVYQDVCIRDTRYPVFMDSNYSYRGTATERLPEFRDIVLRNVRVLGKAGTLRLEGYDAAHRLDIVFDNVAVDDPAAANVTARHARIRLGPGPVNFLPSGDDVTVEGKPGNPGDANACTGKFVPFPAMP